MIRRFYVHNFRCLENFDLPFGGQPQILLIGRNGTGKSTIGQVLRILQRIARGVNRIRELVTPEDFARGRRDVPMRFELEIELNGVPYEYAVAFELPDGFRELRILDEKLAAAGQTVYTRSGAELSLSRSGDGNARFRLDWHLVALPIVQERSQSDPLFVFKQWLARMIILAPIPKLITGDSQGESLEPEPDATNFGAWFAGITSFSPKQYSLIEQYLKKVIPDLSDIRNPVIAMDTRRLEVTFSAEQASFALPFKDLSDGEKCFMICALVLAANKAHGPLMCFWDEPDNYLALTEVGHFFVELRKAFKGGSQFIATSHNPEAIRRFSDENTLVLFRKSHLEPTVARRLADVKPPGDLISALIRDDLEP